MKNSAAIEWVCVWSEEIKVKSQMVRGCNREIEAGKGVRAMSSISKVAKAVAASRGIKDLIHHFFFFDLRTFIPLHSRSCPRHHVRST